MGVGVGGGQLLLRHPQTPSFLTLLACTWPLQTRLSARSQLDSQQTSPKKREFDLPIPFQIFGVTKPPKSHVTVALPPPRTSTCKVHCSRPRRPSSPTPSCTAPSTRIPTPTMLTSRVTLPRLPLSLRHLSTSPRRLGPAPPELLALKELVEDEHHILARDWLDSFVPEDVPKTSYEVSYARSSGPGGQHVNKTNSKAVVRFDVFRARGVWLPPFLVAALQQSVSETGTGDGRGIVCERDRERIERKRGKSGHECTRLCEWEV